MSTAEFGALLREPAPQPRRVREPGDEFDEAFRTTADATDLLPARGLAVDVAQRRSPASPRWRRCSSPCSCSACSSRSCRRRPGPPTTSATACWSTSTSRPTRRPTTSSASRACSRAARSPTSARSSTCPSRPPTPSRSASTPRPTSCWAPTRCPTPSASRPDNPDNALKLRDALSPTSAGGGRTTIDPSIDNVKNSQDDTQKILVATRVVKLTTGLLAILLVVASVLLVSNTIRLSLFSRRREVEVMKLVGATDWFIRWPFVIEGIVLGALGGIMAILLLARRQDRAARPADPAVLAARRRRRRSTSALLIALLLGASVGVSAAGLRALAAPLPARLATGLVS